MSAITQDIRDIAQDALDALDELDCIVPDCSDCDGTGGLTDNECPGCEGKGTIELTPADINGEEHEDISAALELADSLRLLGTTVRDLLDGLMGYGNDSPEMIRKDTFEDYARQFAEDIGAIDKDGSWPTYCIDWEMAASELAMDFSEVEYGGYDWYVRG